MASPVEALTVQDTLAAAVPPNHQLETATTAHEELDLPQDSHNRSYWVRFVYWALSTVVRERIPIPDCNNDTYVELATLARSLDSNETEVKDLIYQPGSPLVEKQILVATATLAFIKMMNEKCVSDDEYGEWRNDFHVLCVALLLEDLKQYPLFAEATREL